MEQGLHGAQASAVVAHELSSCAAWVSCSIGMWDHPWTRDQHGVPCIARQIPNHWTTREVQFLISYYFDISVNVFKTTLDVLVG